MDGVAAPPPGLTAGKMHPLRSGEFVEMTDRPNLTVRQDTMAHHEVEKVLLVGPLPEVWRIFRMFYERVECFYGRLEVQKTSIEIERRANILGHMRSCDRGSVGAGCAEVNSLAICCQE